MPMTVEAVIAYFGIVLAGCAVVSIADSFAAAEIATRLHIARAVAIVTQAGDYLCFLPGLAHATVLAACTVTFCICGYHAAFLCWKLVQRFLST